MSQSLCFQGVLLRARRHENHRDRPVSIPLFSGRITAPPGGEKCSEGDVSIPLFSGRITAINRKETMMKKITSQSLCFQGVLLRLAALTDGEGALSQSLCFQGVLLRRVAAPKPSVWPTSQSLCFQGVLLRHLVGDLHNFSPFCFTLPARVFD